MARLSCECVIRVARAPIEQSCHQRECFASRRFLHYNAQVRSACIARQYGVVSAVQVVVERRV